MNQKICFRNPTKIPKYSDKYKDVLERAYMKVQILKPKQKQLYFYRVKSIGVGAFSFVYLVSEETNAALFAQKSINKKSIAPQLATQIKLHFGLSHPNIISLYHIYSQQGYMHLIMEYGGDSLFVQIKNCKITTINNEKLIYSIIFQIVSAIKYLHTRGIVHADLKLENILYLDGVVKLCDFGYAHFSADSCNKNSKENIKDILGTLQYLDPEYVQGRHSEYSRDIWALGILAYELAVGTNPFAGMSENEKWSTILKIKEIDLTKLKVSAEILNFLKRTLCPIDRRANIQQIANLPMFWNIASSINYSDFQLVIN